MSKMVLMVGLPASGKSTLAKEYAEKFGHELIEMDAIKAPAPKIRETMMVMLDRALAQGKDVIMDGMFVTKKAREMPIKIARSYGAEVQIYPVDTDEETCLKNNQERDRTINEIFITMAAKNYEEPTEDEYDTLIHRSEK